MTHSFKEVAKECLRLGLVPVPTEPGNPKKPIPKGFMEANHDTASAWLRSDRFSNANVAILTGALGGITVLDVDYTDRKVLNYAMQHFGESPLISQTGRGHFHAYYKYNQERHGRYELARTENGEVFTVEIKTKNICVIPPSIGRGGHQAYEFLFGDLEDFSDLPTMTGCDVATFLSAKSQSLGRNGQGNRNDATFMHLKNECSKHETERSLLEYAEAYNQSRNDPPLPQFEIEGIVQRVWTYSLQGKLIQPGEKAAVIPDRLIKELAKTQSALALLVYLKAHHYDQHKDFSVSPRGIAKEIGLSESTVRRACTALVDRKYLECVTSSKRRGNPDGSWSTQQGTYRLTPLSF